jgi:tRNA G26 N,N-dimethylase Trm1
MLGEIVYETSLTVSYIFHSSLIYSHREIKRRVDVVDLDPYGTASPFIDAAAQAVNDGGRLRFVSRTNCNTNLLKASYA